MMKKPNPSVIFLVVLLAKKETNRRLIAPTCSALRPIDIDIQPIYITVNNEAILTLDFENLLYGTKASSVVIHLTLVLTLDFK